MCADFHEWETVCAPIVELKQYFFGTNAISDTVVAAKTIYYSNDHNHCHPSELRISSVCRFQRSSNDPMFCYSIFINTNNRIDTDSYQFCCLTSARGTYSALQSVYGKIFWFFHLIEAIIIVSHSTLETEEWMKNFSEHNCWQANCE